MQVTKVQDSLFFTIPSNNLRIPGTLEPGKVDIRHFRMLSVISMVRNNNMQQALEDVLVRGYTRREACERNSVSQSHFSVKFRHLQMISQTVVRMYPFIEEEVRNSVD